MKFVGTHSPYGLAGLSLMMFATACSQEPDKKEPTHESQPNTVDEPVTGVDNSPLLALTPTEYNNTIRELFGMSDDPERWPSPASVGSTATQAWPWYFPDEAGVNGFEGMANGQIASAYQLEQLYKAAAHFANYAFVAPGFLTCEDWDDLSTAEQTSCGWDSIKKFTQRAWRRPISSSEEQRLEAFWQANITVGSPTEAITISLIGILQSPQFLFRIEHGQASAEDANALLLNDWEIASRLSYFLWDSMPDAALFAAASRGELQTKLQVKEQARRMLQNEKSRQTVTHFHRQWLHTTDMTKVSPARSVYGPLYYGLESQPDSSVVDGTPEDFAWPSILLPVRTSMDLEFKLFVEKTIFDGAGSFTALLTDNHGYVSDTTMPLYGDDVEILSTTGIRFDSSYGGDITLYPAEFPVEQRAGILTLPATMALLSHPVHPSPILRGTFLLTQLTCQVLGTPPPGAEAEAPPDTIDAESTNRQRTEAATSAAACAGCHDRINPPGFAFEHYDSMGGWRAVDNGQPIDASGEISLYNGQSISFQHAVDLVTQLAAHPQARDCYTQHWAQYATGTNLETDNQHLLQLQQHFQDNDSIQELLVEIVASPLFRYRHPGGGQ